MVTITLNIPEDTMRQAEVVAEITQRRLEDVLTEWLDRAANEIPVEQLPDAEVRQLVELQLPESQRQELSDLLTDQREESAYGGGSSSPEYIDADLPAGYGAEIGSAAGCRAAWINAAPRVRSCHVRVFRLLSIAASVTQPGIAVATASVPNIWSWHLSKLNISSL